MRSVDNNIEWKYHFKKQIEMANPFYIYPPLGELRRDKIPYHSNIFPKILITIKVPLWIPPSATNWFILYQWYDPAACMNFNKIHMPHLLLTRHLLKNFTNHVCLLVT